jgi:hypothetical protein
MSLQLRSGNYGNVHALLARLEKRMDEIKQERQISPLPPVVLGELLVVPMGLFAAITGRSPAATAASADTQVAAPQPWARLRHAACS